MNLFLHGLEDFVIARGDTLRNPVFTNALQQPATVQRTHMGAAP